MGVDPRAEAARSSLPESNRTKRCSKVVCTGNNQERAQRGMCSTNWVGVRI